MPKAVLVVAVVLATASCSTGHQRAASPSALSLSKTDTCASYNNADENTRIRTVRSLLAGAGRSPDSASVANALGTASYTCGTNPDFVLGHFTFAGGSRVPTVSPTVVRNHLTFRAVAEFVSAAPVTTDGTVVEAGAAYSKQGMDALDCRSPHPSEPPPAPDAEIVACASSGSEKYHLLPAQLTGAGVASVVVKQFGSGDWGVLISFTPSGQRQFTDLTTALIGKRLAMEVAGIVYSAPTVQNVISGPAQISGMATKQSADQLLRTLTG